MRDLHDLRQFFDLDLVRMPLAEGGNANKGKMLAPHI